MNEQRDNVTDDRLAAKAKTLFDESVDGLDAATVSRLNRNRHEALEAAARGGLNVRWAQWVPATGVLAAAAVVAVLWGREPTVVPMTAPAAASDLEIILEVDDFEMLEELEFYSWIELEEETESHVG